MEDQDKRTVFCSRCNKNWYGWAIDDNLNSCPSCKSGDCLEEAEN